MIQFRVAVKAILRTQRTPAKISCLSMRIHPTRPEDDNSYPGMEESHRTHSARFLRKDANVVRTSIDEGKGEGKGGVQIRTVTWLIIRPTFTMFVSD